MPEGAVDCGAGRGHCEAGHVCTSDRKCITEAEADRRQEAERRANQAQHEARVREEQEKHEALRRRAEEMARAKEEERKQALKSQLEQKLKEATRVETLKKELAEKVKAAKEKAQQEQDATARKKASDIVLEKMAKERQAALLKTTPSGLSYFDRMQMEACDALRREVIAVGGGDPAKSPGKGTCGYNLGPVSPRLLPIPPPIPTEEISPLAAQQLGGLSAGLTAQDLEYLRRNAINLQPEQRRIPVPEKAVEASTALPDTKGQHTFLCGTPPKQYLCPSTIEARQKTDEVYTALGLKPNQTILDRLEERHKKGMEYLRDSPEVKAAIASILAKSVGYGIGSRTGMDVAGTLLTVNSIVEVNRDLRAGKHYEGSLKVINEVSSFTLDTLGPRLGIPPGSSDAINLGGAIATAYLYGFFYGL